MATTKPSGPYDLFVKAEAVPFTWNVFAATDACRHTKCSFGDIIRERAEVDESRSDRGRFAESIGRFVPVPWSIESRIWGGSAAGTELAWRNAILEHAAGLGHVNVGATSDTYSPAANPASSSACMYRVDRNQLLGEYMICCIADKLSLEFTKSDAPKMMASGLAARKWEFMATTLNGAIDNAVTAITLTEPKNLRTGTNALTETGLEIYVLIGTEILKITAMNWTTGVATVAARGVFLGGGAAASHDSLSPVLPVKIAQTFGETGVLGAMDWTVSDGAAAAWRTFNLEVETGRAFDELSSGTSWANAMHNKALKIGGTFGFILNNARSAYWRDLDAGTEKALVITATTGVAGGIFAIGVPHARIKDGLPKDLSSNEPLECTLAFDAKDTQTALASFTIAKT
jgi:hypothetical protein